MTKRMVTGYVVIGKDGRSSKITMRRLTQTMPTTSGREVALKVVLEVDDDLFAQFVPEVKIQVATPDRPPVRVVEGEIPPMPGEN